jgi:hypothetical protein
MAELNLKNATLKFLITHHVGNKYKEESLKLSDESTYIDADTIKYLMKYFMNPFKSEEFYQFTHSVALEMNEVFQLTKNVFAEKEQFLASSRSMAKLLYEYSTHPNIKSGEFHVAYFTDVFYDNKALDAIGIFKSETNVPFIKVEEAKKVFTIYHDFGFELKSLDKACLIFNSDQEEGYRVMVVDQTNKSGEANYWKNQFLKLKPIANEYNNTKEFLILTKSFVSEQLEEESEIEMTKLDKIEIMSRSIEYFQERTSFDKEEFEETVLIEPKIIESFRKFDETYREDQDMELSDNFEISPKAVKKQSSVYKSILKLDKNFHVYIHGNRELIQRGTEDDGRKYYKIYYESEE